MVDTETLKRRARRGHEQHKAMMMARLVAGIAWGSLAMHSAAASAQVPEQVQAPADQVAEDEPSDQIVVTGTQIRGIAPAGTNVVGLSREDIIATGATSANEILTKVPQVTSAFLATPTVSAQDAGLSLIRPNLRDLGASGTNTTLVLIDGHRVVGAGVLQTTADPDMIPPGAVERVEIIPDGGSSIYGSDAIGGVINFITRRKFDGLEASGRYGFADNYEAVDINLTAGKDWGSGSGYISYAFARNNELLGRDRDFVRQISNNAGYCSPGTIQANGTTYSVATRAPGTMSTCDNTDYQSFWPRVSRHSVVAGLNQELSDSITLDARAFYTRREITNFRDFTLSGAQTLQVTNANPYFQTIAGETTQTVLTNFNGAIDSTLRNQLDTYELRATVTADLGAGWQMRFLANYGASKTTSQSSTVDADAVNAALAGTTTATALNPYNLRASAPGVLANVIRNDFNDSKQQLYNFRAILDGALFPLGASEARVAVGAEYLKEKATIRQGTVPFGQEGFLARRPQSREVKAVFGELALPFVSAGNAVEGIQAVTLSLSGRYDDYSDVGGTFNPKIGLTYQPVDWVKIRGNWGKSFNAPSIIDQSGVQAIGALPVPFVPGQQAPWSVVLAGNDGQNTPQKANTWSVGFDVTPPFAPGLSLSATYYKLHLKDVIGLLLGQNLSFNAATAPFLADNQSCSAVQARYASVPSFLVPLSVACGISPNVALLDFRVQNLGSIDQDGIDFNFRYETATGFGSVNAGIAGTYTLNRKVAIVSGDTLTDNLASPGRNRLAFVASIGADAGDLSGQISWNHRQGFDLNPVVVSTRFGSQDRVDSFSTIDLFLSYALPEAVLGDAAITLNVTNLFDQDPPFYNGSIGTSLSGFANGSTLGRLVSVGLRKKF